jgi:urea transport system permease protein
MSTANSIEIAIWAAVGGRATLIGPIIGAFIVNGAKSWLTVAYPEYWLYFLGALFIAVTLFLPDGIVGLVRKWMSRARSPASEGRLEAQRGVALEQGLEPEAMPAPAPPMAGQPEGARA